MNDRFGSLLPWYVNGTLSEEDRQWVEVQLRDRPEALAELEWQRSLRKGIVAAAPQVSETLGLARTLRRIEEIEAAAPEWRLASWLRWLGVERASEVSARNAPDAYALRPALGLALAVVVVVQTGVIVAGLMGEESAGSIDIRSGPTVPVTDGPLLKVTFTPAATEADIRFALIAVQGTLAGGPGQLGDYYVRVPKGTEAAAQVTLQAQVTVASVEAVPGPPQKP